MISRRLLRIALPTAGLAALATTALAGEPSTTRVETRAFYGATVTIEEGVRVFRTLPSHNRVIINPEAKASLSLGFEDNRTTSHNYNYNGTSPGSSSSTSGSAPVSGTSPGIAYPLPPVDFKGVPARGGRH